MRGKGVGRPFLSFLSHVLAQLIFYSAMDSLLFYIMGFFATFSYSCNLIIKFLAKKFINEKNETDRF